MEELVDKLCIDLKESLSRLRDLDRKLYSLILYGSIVRGDFILGVSDIDFFAVVMDESIIPWLKELLIDICKDLEVSEVDLAWEYLENLNDPLNKGYPFKFLTIYQDDFVRNSIVIYGRDVVGMLPKYDTNSLVTWRCRFLLNLLDQYRGNIKMLHIIAGETARLLAWIEKRSLHKKDVLKALTKIGDVDALNI